MELQCQGSLANPMVRLHHYLLNKSFSLGDLTTLFLLFQPTISRGTKNGGRGAKNPKRSTSQVRFIPIKISKYMMAVQSLASNSKTRMIPV